MEILDAYERLLRDALAEKDQNLLGQSMELIEAALLLVDGGNHRMNTHIKNTYKDTAAALRANNGGIYTGVNTNLKNGQGIDAEQAAMHEMLKDNQTIIQMGVAIADDGLIINPCGVCRQEMSQLDINNRRLTRLIVVNEKSLKIELQTLENLLPNETATTLLQLRSRGHEAFFGL